MNSRQHVLNMIDDAYEVWNGNVWEIRFPTERFGGSYTMAYGDTWAKAWDNAAFSIDCYLAD